MQTGLDRGQRFDQETFEAFDEAVSLGEQAQDAEAIRGVAAALETHVAEMRSSPAATVHADDNYLAWISSFEQEASRYRNRAAELDTKRATLAPAEAAPIVLPTAASENGDELSQAIGSERTPDSDTALRIVRERYARGEIDRDEFLQLKEDLKP